MAKNIFSILPFKALEKMIALERSGAQKKAGFYQYEPSQKRELWSELSEHFPAKNELVHAENMMERLLFAQVLEAGWCMQEKVVLTVAEANLGSVHGWGFPSFKGGVHSIHHGTTAKQRFWSVAAF